MRTLGLLGVVAALWAQRLVSRIQIEVEGYSVEKVGLPQSPVGIAPNQFAFVEYFAAGKLKPKASYYLECLDTDYNERWSLLLDIPAAGQGKPLRLVRMARALLAISQEADPLQKGVIQEVGRFLSLRGQPILPKWTAISNYDRALPLEGQLSLSPDSTYLLWLHQVVDKKGRPIQTYYTIWSENGRKVGEEKDWNSGGILLAAQPDNRARIWALRLPPGKQVPELLFYDPKSRQSRTWPLTTDTLWLYPHLHLTARGAWVLAFRPAEKNIPTEHGAIGAAVLAYFPQAFSDSTTPKVGSAPLPEPFLATYKDPIRPTLSETFILKDSTAFIIWEDRRVRSGAHLGYDLWVARWDLAGDSLGLGWFYRIEKRQREETPDAIGALYALTPTFLQVLFLTERTGKGTLRVYQINLETGEALTKDLGQNTAGDLLILPGRLAVLTPTDRVCLALPRPGKNGYQIFHFRF